MPFRWSRLFQKPDSSSSSSSSSGWTDDGISTRRGDRKPISHTPKAVNKASGSSSRLSSLASSRLSRIVSLRSSTATTSSASSGRSSAAVSQRGSRAANRAGPRALNLHPSERPLTEQNLRHQEVLGRFTMKVAQRRLKQKDGEVSPSAVSPRDSRSMSLDMAAAMMGRGRTFETAFRDWKIDERGEDEEREAEEVPLHQRRITEESINV